MSSCPIPPPGSDSPESATPPPARYRFRDQRLQISRGAPLPLGARLTDDGVNFVLLSCHARSVCLVLMEPCSDRIEAEIPLDPVAHRTGHHWHVRVRGLPDDFCYGYRVDGPTGPLHRFNPRTILLDPTSRALSCGRPWGFGGQRPRRSLLNRHLAAEAPFDAPRPPGIPLEDTILYELHLRGFTVHPSSGTRHGGTYAALADKIQYLKDLGVTAVELMPIDEFDELDCPFINPKTGDRLRNFWGYNTIAYAAPKAAYAVNPEGSAPWEEFRAMVRAFHAAGLEIILDVVFNHTAEGNDAGPTYSFRGIDNSLYYMVDEKGRFLNYSGCGNTVNTNHPVVRNLILDGLRTLVADTEIDGLRFDLASVFGRDRRGHVIVEPPVIEEISDDGLLADTKLIAEPWDAAGLYQVDSFPGGGRWSVWNGRFRDDVRRFWRGDLGMCSDLASRICGSDDLFGNLSPLHSINFVTCHDGFTLHDLVSYNHKHNEANGEGNRDGSNANWSWNGGVEGPTRDPDILALRNRQARNLIATLLVAQGIPMLLGGDEFLRSQGGNNNAWCQDNPTSWVDWGLATENRAMRRFTRQMIALRKRHHVLRRRSFFPRGGPPAIQWHGVFPQRPDWSYTSRTLAFSLDGRRGDRPDAVDRDIYVALNAHSEPVTFRIPAAPTSRHWRRCVDTARPSPDDILDLDEGPVIAPLYPYTLEGRSMIVLISEA